MRRFLCLWFPYWPTDRWRRQSVDPVSGPLALTARGQGGIRLVAVDAKAAALGLSVGMTLADARALLPDLTAADAEPEADSAALVGLADWCGRYSPWSATDGGDGIRLDITGCAHLFGGEARLLAEVLARLGRFGLAVQGAVADTPAAAWAWARYRRAKDDPVLGSGEIGPLLALPVAALNLEPETVLTLGRLGLGTIGAVSALPRAPLAKRLGERLMERLDRLFGRAPEPISPRQPSLPRLARMVFAEPIGRREDIDEATARLATRLCGDLARDGMGGRRLTLAFYRVDGAVQRLAVGTSRPMHEPDHLLRLFAERLERVEPGFGIEAMALEAEESQDMVPVQATLAAADRMDEIDLARLVDRLRNRLGPDRVLQALPVESHVPERAERWVPAAFRLPLRVSQDNRSDRHSRESGNPWSSSEMAEKWIPAFARMTMQKCNMRSPTRIGEGHQRAARPLKLLAHPEPIEATAPVPDDPPLSFRWRRVLHRVTSADGPERIGPEWWRPGPGRPRDYYRIEDAEGRRFWVYREGLYGASDPPRWFLHGFFA